MFSGIGGFELGISRAMANAECVGYSEIDKHAINTYEGHYAHKNYGDATTITTEQLPDFDLIVGGFPCQAFSVAGKRRGFDEARGTLFFDIARIAADKRPSHLLLENVRGLLSHDGGKTFQTILGVLTELGYVVEWQLLNSKDFGVPQNRERIYFVCHLASRCTRKVFPITRKNSTALGGDENFVDLQFSGAKVTKEARTIQARYHKGYSKRNGENSGVLVGTLRTHKHGEGFREMKDGIAPTLAARARNDGSGQAVIATPVLTPDREEKRQNGRRFKNDEDPAFTVNTQDRHGVMIREATKVGYAIAEEGDSINTMNPISKTRRGRVGKGIANTVDTSMHQATLQGAHIRRLTPTECERLQGFPDEWTHYYSKPFTDSHGLLQHQVIEQSDSQRYKQCGNAVTVNTVEAVMRELAGCFE